MGIQILPPIPQRGNRIGEAIKSVNTIFENIEKTKIKRENEQLMTQLMRIPRIDIDGNPRDEKEVQKDARSLITRFQTQQQEGRKEGFFGNLFDSLNINAPSKGITPIENIVGAFDIKSLFDPEFAMKKQYQESQRKAMEALAQQRARPKVYSSMPKNIYDSTLSSLGESLIKIRDDEIGWKGIAGSEIPRWTATPTLGDIQKSSPEKKVDLINKRKRIVGDWYDEIYNMFATLSPRDRQKISLDFWKKGKIKEDIDKTRIKHTIIDKDGNKKIGEENEVTIMKKVMKKAIWELEGKKGPDPFPDMYGEQFNKQIEKKESTPEVFGNMIEKIKTTNPNSKKIENKAKIKLRQNKITNDEYLTIIKLLNKYPEKSDLILKKLNAIT